MSTRAARSPFAAALVTEAVRELESRGPLDDAQALRAALAAAPGREAQVAERAWLLGERLELPERLRRARAAAPFVLLGLAALIALAGFLLAGQVVGATDRRINVMAALAALLGVHAFTLALWLLLLLWPGSGAGSTLGRLWLELTARLTLGRGAEPAALLRALLALLERARLLPWVLGFASHAVWALSFAAVLAALVFALMFRSYTLSWETTILDPQSFVAAVRALGVAPAWLGFPVPDAATVLAPVADAAGQRRWALWLVGCVLVYGLLPRLLCALWCAAVWRLRRARLAPDHDAPYYRKLFARLDALAPPVVVDAEARAQDWQLAQASYAGQISDTFAVLGFELPPEVPWPPGPLPPGPSTVLKVDGGAGERRDALDTLARLRPRALVLACHAGSSPDRGTERFLRELLPTCGQCHLWLTAAAEPAPAQCARWQSWLAASGLQEVGCFADWESAIRFEAAPQ